MPATPTPTSAPCPSPWPAPTLAEAARRSPDSRSGVTEHERRDRPRRIADALQAARRLIDPDLRAEHAAACEEQRIAAELADLPCGWFVCRLAEVESLGVHADATDHFAIGPGGVFIVRCERHPAAQIWVSEQTMTIDGRAGNRLGEAHVEARYASMKLSDRCGFDVTVQTILVMIGAIVHTVSRPAEVHVRDQHDLRDWMCMQPVRLDAETIGAISRRVSRAASQTVS